MVESRVSINLGIEIVGSDLGIEVELHTFKNFPKRQAFVGENAEENAIQAILRGVEVYIREEINAGR